MDINSKINNELEKVKQLSKEKKKTIYEETTHLIEYYEKMSSEMENRRTDIYKQSVSKISILIPVFTTLIGINFKFPSCVLLIVPLYVMFSISIINAIIIMVVYMLQSQSKYISKDVRLNDYGNYWKRFYYGNPDILKIDTSVKKFWRYTGYSNSNAYDEKMVNAYVDGLAFTLKNYATESIDDMVEKNIIHSYLLQVHNYYKNRHQMTLAKINQTCLLINGFATLFTIIIMVIIACVN